MNSYQKKQAYEKCCYIIVSCNTRDQLNTAKKYVNLFNAYIRSPIINSLLNDLIQEHSQFCI